MSFFLYMWVRFFTRWAVIMDRTVPATHLSHHGPASAMQPHASGMLVGAWSAPPSAGVAGGPHITSSGPPGDAGPPVQGVAGESGSKGPLRPSGSTQPGPAFSIIEPVARLGAGPTAGALPSDDAGGAEDPTRSWSSMRTESSSPWPLPPLPSRSLMMPSSPSGHPSLLWWPSSFLHQDLCRISPLGAVSVFGGVVGFVIRPRFLIWGVWLSSPPFPASSA